jgi:hypothetical protein
MTHLNGQPQSDEWRDFAACSTVDPEIFFPKPGDRRVAEQARAVCASCPVRRKCLTDILRAEGGRGPENRHGVVGGKSPKQRYLLYVANRNRQRAAA